MLPKVCITIIRYMYGSAISNVYVNDPVIFEKARQRAKELDEEFARTGKLIGPLHGVPLSVKV